MSRDSGVVADGVFRLRRAKTRNVEIVIDEVFARYETELAQAVGTDHDRLLAELKRELKRRLDLGMPSPKTLW